MPCLKRCVLRSLFANLIKCVREGRARNEYSLLIIQSVCKNWPERSIEQVEDKRM